MRLQRFRLCFSKITFWVKPCQRVYQCSSMNNHSLMLYLEEDSTSIFGSGWTLLWTKNENATLIVYRTWWKKSTENELRKGRESDWKSGLIVDLPIIMISDQIKHSHIHTGKVLEWTLVDVFIVTRPWRNSLSHLLIHFDATLSILRVFNDEVH